MSQSTELAFAPDESAAILRHMNGDHGADSLLMVRAFGNLPAADAARVVGVDKAGIDFAASAGGFTHEVRIPWGRTLSDRAEVRGEVVRLYNEACAALGIEPRQGEQDRH